MLIKIVGKNPAPLWAELQKKYNAKSLINEFEPGWRLELNCSKKTLTYLKIAYSDRIKFYDNPSY